MKRLRRDEAGMVTAEMATALPVLVLLIIVGTASIAVGQQRVRCADAAREAARAVARGEDGRAYELAVAAAGAHVAVSIERGPEITQVRVVRNFRPVSWLPGLSVAESAATATEAPP